MICLLQPKGDIRGFTSRGAKRGIDAGRKRDPKHLPMVDCARLGQLGYAVDAVDRPADLRCSFKRGRHIIHSHADKSPAQQDVYI